MKIVFVLFFALLPIITFGEQQRHVSVTVPTPNIYSTNVGTGYPQYTFYNRGATNSIQVSEGETAEIISLEGFDVRAVIYRDQIALQGRPSSNYGRGTTVAGPAVITLSQAYNSIYLDPDPNYQGALLTVKLSPMTASPQPTVAVAPGMGVVSIALESSTNLVNWFDATNGIYGDNLRFFRVRLTKSN